MKKIIFCLFIFLSINIFSVNFPEYGENYKDFIPKGWKVISIKEGDFNKDKLNDIVLIIEKNDPKNIKKRDYYDELLNTNPRILLIIFKINEFKYKLVSKNDRGFIFSRDKAIFDGNSEIFSIFDGFINDGTDVVINKKNNTLKIRTQYEYMRGISMFEYIFRFQNNRFELIGMKNENSHKSADTHFSSEYSLNFSTKMIEGKEESWKVGEDNSEQIFIKKRIDVEYKYILDEMTEETYNEISKKYIYPEFSF